MAITRLWGIPTTTLYCVQSRHKSLPVATKASSFSLFLDGLRVVLDSVAVQGECIHSRRFCRAIGPLRTSPGTPQVLPDAVSAS